MEHRVPFVTLAVRDLDRSRAFSVDGLGWSSELEVPGDVLMLAAGERLVLSSWNRTAFEEEVGGPALDGAGVVPFADPDGFRWEVAWNPGPIGLRVAPDTDVDARP